ncbi:hypothetical protein [Leptospira wolffii]|uniref:hypothetical protein n=1 Tax=Leptospira wolffii TaxID=409998 RepID=UPI0012EB26A1|nr:hypothetical protein [Leptospira wolffii]
MLFLLLTINCDGHSPDGCDACPFLLLPQWNAKFQIKNRTDIGNGNFHIQGITPSLSPGALSLQYSINTNEKGTYRLVADIGGELFNFPNFDFSGTINDGAFITTPGTIVVGKCNLFDGPTGTIIPDGCL